MTRPSDYKTSYKKTTIWWPFPATGVNKYDTWTENPEELQLSRAVRLGIIDVNPLTNFEKLPAHPSSRYVTDVEIEHALSVGRSLGGASLIAALALKMALK